MIHYESFQIETLAIYCPIKIGDHHGYGLVDTGARGTTVLSSIANDFKRTGEATAKSAFGTQVLEKGIAPDIEFLGVTFSGQPVTIQDSLHLSGMDDSPLDVLVRIGQNLLGHLPLHLDFSSNRIGFVPLSDVNDMEISAEVSTTTHFNLPFFHLTIDGQRFQAIFDTGAGMTCINMPHLTTLQSSLIKDEPQEVIDAMGAKTTIDIWQHNAVYIDGQPFSNVKLIPIPLAQMESALQTPVDFIYGLQSMQTRNWIFDASNERLLILA